MTLSILAAIDLAGGEVVRLTQGDFARRTVYGDDPVAVARRWEAEGADWLHVVDLDGAAAGRPVNTRAAARIIESVTLPVQVSGGVRSAEAIEAWLAAGASRVCLGTRALDPAFLAGAVAAFGDRLLPAVDALGGRVQVAGWLEEGGLDLLEAVRRVASSGAARLMFTSIERDGTLAGPDVGAISTVLDAAGVPLIASGGISGPEDLVRLAALVPDGLEGVVVGKALYDGALTLAEARRAVAGGSEGEQRHQDQSLPRQKVRTPRRRARGSGGEHRHQPGQSLPRQRVRTPPRRLGD